MATERKYKATIEIGGAVASSLKSSFAAVTGNTKALGASLSKLTSQQRKLEGFNSAQLRIGETQKKLMQAMKAGDTSGVERLRKSLDTQRQSLTKLGEELKKAKINTGDLSGEMERLGRKADATRKVMDSWGKIKPIGDNFKTVATRTAGGFVAVGAAAAAASAAIWKLGAGFGSFADEAAEASSNIGVNTNFLLGLRFAAEQTGASAELADKALMEMVKRVKDADEEGDKAGEALLKLGLNIQKVQKLDAASQFATIADAFAKMPESAEKTALAFELFGKAGRKLPNLLNLGREGLNAKLQAAKDAGYLLSEADKMMGDEFDEAMGNFKLAAQGAANTVGRELLPVLTDLVKEIGGFIRAQGPQLKAWAQDFGGWLKANAPTIGQQIKEVALSMVQLAREAGPVIEKLGGLKFVVGALATAAFAPLIASFASLGAALITALPTVISITTGLWGMAAAAAGGSAALIPIIGTVALVVAGITALGYAIYQVVQNWDTYSWAIGEAIESTKAFGVAIYDNIVGAFDNVRVSVGSFFDWIGSKFAFVSSSLGRIKGMVGFGGGAQEPIAGARAAGGPVTGGKRYLVGENGPELFTPGASGSIIPNNRLGGSVDSRSYNITINAAPGMDERSIADLVMARLDGRQAALAGGALYD